MDEMLEHACVIVRSNWTWYQKRLEKCGLHAGDVGALGKRLQGVGGR